jgi:DNA (cytosine-5)-methyltransferase 1
VNIELFPCSGGLAAGLRRAGIEFDLAFDWSKEACDSYEANMGHRPVQIDARDLLRLARAGAFYAQVDLLVADPPCTPYSRAGKRLGPKDERDMLGVTVDLIDYLRPRAWLIANVPGLDDSDSWEAVVKPVIGRMAQRAGYCVDYASLNAADFGVPQVRIRPFWFGHPVTTACIRWPAPTHAKPNATLTLPGLEALPHWVTCRQALGHLTGKDLGRPVRLRWRNPDHRAAGPDEPAKTQTGNPNGDGSLLVGRDKRRSGRAPALPDAPAPTQTAGGQGGGALVTGSWPWDRPATTVTRDERIPPPGHHADGSYMSDGVVLSERARKILQGLPEDWTLAGATKTARSEMLGMLMPPPLAEAVGRAIVEWRAAAGMAAQEVAK